MNTLSLTDILDDLRAAEEGLHKFERRYWISSEDFYALYSQGMLDDGGENASDFSEWAGHYKLECVRKPSPGVSPGRARSPRQRSGTTFFEFAYTL